MHLRGTNTTSSVGAASEMGTKTVLTRASENVSINPFSDQQDVNFVSEYSESKAEP